MELVRLDRELRRRARRIYALLEEAGIEGDALRDSHGALREQLRLTLRLEALSLSQRLFRYWHLFHLPLAKAMYLIIALHVASAIVFGGALGRLSELGG